MPIDDTTPAIADQVAAWKRSLSDAPNRCGLLIHERIARAIAAWYQTPYGQGYGMAQYASTGAITDDLLSDLAWEHAHADGGSDADALAALDAYVLSRTVTVWSVGNNTPGCLPIADVSLHLAYRDARATYVAELDDAPDALCGEACECGSPDGEACDGCAMAAHIGAYRTDGMLAGEAEQVIYLQSDTSGVPTVFWLNRTSMSVEEYIASSDV